MEEIYLMHFTLQGAVYTLVASSREKMKVFLRIMQTRYLEPLHLCNEEP